MDNDDDPPFDPPDGALGNPDPLNLQQLQQEHQQMLQAHQNQQGDRQRIVEGVLATIQLLERNVVLIAGLDAQATQMSLQIQRIYLNRREALAMQDSTDVVAVINTTHGEYRRLREGNFNKFFFPSQPDAFAHSSAKRRQHRWSRDRPRSEPRAPIAETVAIAAPTIRTVLGGVKI